MKLMLRNVPNLVTNVKMMVMEEMINAKMRLRKISARKSKSLAARMKLMLRNVPNLVTNVKMMMEEMMTAKMRLKKISARKSKRRAARMKLMLRNVPRVVANVVMMEVMTAKTEKMDVMINARIMLLKISATLLRKLDYAKLMRIWLGNVP